MYGPPVQIRTQAIRTTFDRFQNASLFQQPKSRGNTFCSTVQLPRDGAQPQRLPSQEYCHDGGFDRAQSSDPVGLSGLIYAYVEKVGNDLSD